MRKLRIRFHQQTWTYVHFPDLLRRTLFRDEALPWGPLTVTFTDFIASTEGIISTANSAVQLYCMSDNKEHVAD